MPIDRAPYGLILAGGGAARMGGGDKALLRVGDRPILARVAACLSPQCEGLLLSANGDPARFAAFGLAVVPDHPEDRGSGPLAGLLAGLDHIASVSPATTLALTAAADTPFLPDDLAAILGGARARDGAAIACARSGGREHPLAGLWPVALRHDLRDALRSDGIRRVSRFLNRHAVAWADWPATPGDPFLNVNTPDDLLKAERLNGLRA